MKLTFDRMKEYKQKAKRQRDNWKRRALVYQAALIDINAMDAHAGNWALVIKRAKAALESEQATQ
jgi:hypothetical protein